ncbi:MAG: peptidylprolyl isomerase [Acidobacteriota bacterium]|nr:peptidylprolyl isomerase [Acidobacteriota bacterium]
MSKKNLILLLLFAAFFSASCNANKSNKNAVAAEVKKGVKPVADNEIAVIEMQQPAYGTIKLELYSNIAPKMVERFKELAKEGVYNGTTFHRINDSVIQGGDPLSKDDDPTNDGTGNSDKPNVPAEFSDVPYDAGIVGAARTADPNTANSQFFITLKRQPAFDNKYTIFGKVIEGMNNVRTISGVTPKDGERPVENVVVKSITIQPK